MEEKVIPWVFVMPRLFLEACREGAGGATVSPTCSPSLPSSSSCGLQAQSSLCLTEAGSENSWSPMWLLLIKKGCLEVWGATYGCGWCWTWDGLHPCINLDSHKMPSPSTVQTVQLSPPSLLLLVRLLRFLPNTLKRLLPCVRLWGIA